MPPVVSLASLPGPPAWPLVGNLPQLGMSSMHERLQAWAHVHGPAYRVRLGPRGDVEWVSPSENGGPDVVQHTEPETDFGSRLKLELLAPLVPESLL